jgi:transcriptional regulator with XRE-family HTH domain
MRELMAVLTIMGFSERLVALRRERKMTQQQLSDESGVHISQIKRYETGTSEPSIDALRKIALALNVSSDSLLFDEDERGPHTDELRLHFEAVRRMNADDQKIVVSIIDAYVKRHQIESIMQTR